MKMRALAALAVVVLLGVGLVGCGSKAGTGTPATTPTTGQAVTIVEQDYAFTPSSLTVKVGDVVTFVNKDSTVHRVSIDGQDLGQQSTGKSVTWTATKAGTFPFSCTIHPDMTGQMTVQ